MTLDDPQAFWVAGEHLTWTDSREPAELPEEQGTPQALDEEIVLLYRRLVLPGAMDAAQRAQIKAEAEAGVGRYLAFVSSVPLVQAGEALTILDVELDNPIPALTARLLMPNVRLLKLVRGAAEGQAIDAVTRANDLVPLQMCSVEEMAAVLKDETGPVLLQGAEVFDLLGEVLDGLGDERRRTLSIFTTSDEIIPGNRVFPCANVQITCPSGWTLNHSASIDVMPRRHGLDIAVAACNAGDFLPHCVESLLCEGRDDVRVIVVDDGSTDGSGEALARQFADDPRVRVERKPNGGCASARNYGRLVSDATHIAFVDADDFVSPGLFADLYDLALYSGCEVVQSGYDFHDAALDEPFYPSAEEDRFRESPRTRFKDKDVLRLFSDEIIKGQPTIWRKVYRRDFLDAKAIYFPENVRAFDDYVFQIFTLTAARDVFMLPEHKYHYRQHPRQHSKQRDERHFYMLYMFQMIVKRSLSEGWPNFRPYAESIVDSISWSSSMLRTELVESFLRASARFCVGVSKTYGPAVIEDLLPGIEHPDFEDYYREEKEKVLRVAPGPFWAYFTGELYHPDIVRMRQAMRKAT
ncbi:glycosyltransferase [Mesobacterium pallidum]|uniref:glycosyltransferase n=1 Tax=Mesobacterium pallidum TaxID=2872037 RepID=UPI001EE2D7D9|nr:glycosyltransferase [Mesobacterium pallidum]